MKTENGDVSVPITWAYNHHYCAYLSGSYAEMKEIDALDWAEAEQIDESRLAC